MTIARRGEALARHVGGVCSGSGTGDRRLDGPEWLLRSAGDLWIVSDPLGPADAVAIFGGLGSRRVAIELTRTERAASEGLASLGERPTAWRGAHGSVERRPAIGPRRSATGSPNGCADTSTTR